MRNMPLVQRLQSIGKAILGILLKPFRWFKRTRRRNKVFTILALIILLPIIIGQVSAMFAPPPYDLQKVTRENIEEVVSETGNVNAGGRVDIYSTTTGIIEEMYVANGEYVTVDQALFRVRSTATEPEKANAYATYLNAVNNQKLAEQGQEFNDAQMWAAQQQRLSAQKDKQKMIDRTDLPNELDKFAMVAEETQTEKSFRANEKKFKESNYSISAAQGQVNATWLAYQATQNSIVKATTNGTIANLSSEIGDNVNAGASAGLMSAAGGASAGLSGSAAPVLTIANLSSDYSIKISLNETDIPKIQEGQEASITLDAFPRRKFEGSVTQVDSIGTNTQGVITYNVLISIHNAPKGIKPGMTADVNIVVDKVEKVLAVPNSAVKPYKGGKAVRIPTADKKDFTYVPVEIGLKGEAKTQIIKGLQDGQEVVTALANEKVQRQGGGFF